MPGWRLKQEVLFLYVHLGNFLTHSLEGARPMVLTETSDVVMLAFAWLSMGLGGGAT